MVGREAYTQSGIPRVGREHIHRVVYPGWAGCTLWWVYLRVCRVYTMVGISRVYSPHPRDGGSLEPPTRFTVGGQFWPLC